MLTYHDLLQIVKQTLERKQVFNLQDTSRVPQAHSLLMAREKIGPFTHVRTRQLVRDANVANEPGE